MKHINQTGRARLVAMGAALLVSCGGGADGDGPGVSQTPEAGLSAEEAGAQIVLPTFDLAPVVLDAPDDQDTARPDASAGQPPHAQTVSAELGALSTRRLTVQAMGRARRLVAQGLSVKAAASAVQDTLAAPEGAASAQPLAAGSSVATYTPAQIRAAYGLPALPAAGTTPSAEQRAQLGAGQTIYIVDAQHDPNVVAELDAFNQKFGLPGCTSQVLPATTSLPLPAASVAEGCVFSVAYGTAAGGLSASAPAYDASWATEIALDVQWAHATAPLARIVLIEVPDASVNALVGGVRLANAMGPGLVSMSFGANEGSWTANFDVAFTAAGMSYLAATGDWGAGVMWPAVSPTVLAVGGTRLTYGGSGARSEVGWSLTGGGISQYTPTPACQAQGVPGGGTLARRAVADVAFNADPGTGQYVAILTPGSSAVNWVSAGGTSLSTPQWAGLLAVANALRLRAGKAVLGMPHGVLYGEIGAAAGNYGRAFADIASGSNGSCATCTARAGYDALTGLGTPNGTDLLAALSGSGATVAATPPVVQPASISALVGTALTFKVTASASHPLSYRLTGAPSGMTISSAGVVSWPKPVAGSYAVSVIATDSQTGLSGQAVSSVKVTLPPTPPVVSAGSVSGKVGTALSFTVGVKSSNPVSFELAGAPAGMTISSAGVVSWPNPVAGSYPVSVTATAAATGLSGKAVWRVSIAKVPPVIVSTTLTGVAGQPLSGSFSVRDPGGSAWSLSVTGVPAGLTLALDGSTVTLNWPKPRTGRYTLAVTVKNAAGLSAKASVPIVISAK